MPPLDFPRLFVIFVHFPYNDILEINKTRDMEDENLNFSFGEGDERKDRKLKKSQVNVERLACMFGVSDGINDLFFSFVIFSP